MLSSNVVLTRERLAETVEFFLTQPAFAFDLETHGDNRGVPHCNSASWIVLATKGRVAVIPFGHPIGSRVIGEAKEPRTDKNGKVRMFRVPVYDEPPKQLSRAEVFAALRPLFFKPGIVKIAHGAQFDIATIAKYFDGEIPPGPWCCSITLRWILDENRNRYGLKYITKDVYGFTYDEEDVGKCVEKYPFNMVAHYVYCDGVYAWLEYVKLRPQIDQEGLGAIYDLEMAVLPILARMRLTGIDVDEKRLEEMRADLSVRVTKHETDIYRAAGKKFNINSVAQKRDVLYLPKSKGGQGLKPWRMTKGGKKRAEDGETPDLSFYSTDDEALESYTGNSVVDAILQYQEVYKLLNTYVLGYLGNPDAKDKPCRIFDSRIFADFVQYGTKTGRLSCREPNLQNVGRPDTELGKLIRGAFVAAPGRKLIVADYGQIELVVLAHLLGQGMLYQGFLDGIDPHTMCAAGILHKDPADVTKDERQAMGKTMGFTIVNGAGPGKIASMAGVSLREAKDIMRKHEDEFPEIYGFKEFVFDECRRARPPHVTTLLGRKRRVPAINSPDRGMRMYSERQAFNAVIQGGAADLIKLAMTRMPERMPEWMKLHLSVHDELVTSAPVKYADDAAAILLDAMTGPGIKDLIRVPLKADIAIVDRWADAK